MLAIKICRIYLDMVRNALIVGDFALYSQCMMLPLTLMSPHAHRVVTTEQGLRDTFHTYLAALCSQQVTNMIPMAEKAERMAADAITCDYVTHALRHGHRVAPPHKSRMTLRHQGGAWRTSAINNAFYNSNLVDPGAPRLTTDLNRPLTIAPMDLT